MTENNKVKVPIWMYPDMVAKIDSTFPQHNCRSRSEYVCDAVKFYTGFLETGKAEDYISKSLLSVMNSTVELTEERICRTLFKLAVEIAIASHITACSNQIDPDTMQKLRERCIRDVKQSIGTIRFDKIYSFQHHLDQEMSDDDLSLPEEESRHEEG